MRVLLTGASGFLGSHIAEQLTKRGDIVRGFVRKSSNVEGLKKLNAELAYGVLERGEGLQEALADVDVVIHCAGVVKALEPEEFQRVNAGGTEHLLEAVRRHKRDIKRFILISSLEAFGPTLDGGIPKESDTPHPPTHYGRSKLAAEKLVLAAKDEFPVTILRPTGIYGPRDTEMYQFYQAAARGVMPLISPRDGTFTIVYGPDCAAAALKAIDVPHESGRIYFVSDGRIYTWGEGEKIFRSVFGAKLLAFQIPHVLVRVAAKGADIAQHLTKKPGTFNSDKLGMLLAKHMNCSSDALQNELGWKPTLDFEEGSKITVRWYRENGWL